MTYFGDLDIDLDLRSKFKFTLSCQHEWEPPREEEHNGAKIESLHENWDKLSTKTEVTEG